MALEFGLLAGDHRGQAQARGNSQPVSRPSGEGRKQALLLKRSLLLPKLRPILLVGWPEAEQAWRNRVQFDAYGLVTPSIG